MQENVLFGSQIVIERKEFTITLRENPRGRFVRIVERCGNRPASIIIPVAGLKEFQQLLADMVRADKGIVPKTKPS